MSCLRSAFVAHCCTWLLYGCSLLPAQHHPAALGEFEGSVVSEAELVWELQSLTVEQRQELLSTPTAINAILERMMLRKSLADEARARFDADNDQHLQLKLASLREGALGAYAVNEYRRQTKLPDPRRRAADYYDSHPQEFARPARYRLSQIFRQASEAATQNVAKRRLAKVREQILNGQLSFAQAAAEHSMDPFRYTGGSVHHERLGSRDPMLERAIADLEAGQLSQPLVAPEGVYLLRLEEREDPGPIPFEDIEPAIIQKLEKEYREAQSQLWVQSLVDGYEPRLSEAQLQSLRRALLPAPDDRAQ